MVTPMVFAQRKSTPLVVCTQEAKEATTYDSSNPCQICGKHFTVYSKGRVNQRCCGEVCRLRRKSLKREEWKKSISRKNGVISCPNPSKKEFQSPFSAWKWIDARHVGENMFPYFCKCGALHIGHDEVGDRIVYNRQGVKVLSADIK